MVNILQTVSKAFSWMKIIIFWFKFHWHRILWVQLTIYKHWFWSRFWPSDILACCNHVSYQTCTWWDSKQTLWRCLGENKLIQYGLVVVYVMIVKIWAYVMNKIDANCVVSGSTRGCHHDNLRCCQWKQSWHHDNSYRLQCVTGAPIV